MNPPSENVVFSVIFVAITAAVCWLLWHEHKNEDSGFTLERLLTDKAVREGIIQYGAFVITSFVLCYIAVKGTLAEWLFIGYGALWVVKDGLNAWLESRKPKPEPSA